MADALGHAEYAPSLLFRYLPLSVLTFFQERWIRIFQQGIVVKALEDSAFLLEASNFGTMSEVDEFLKNHALKSIPKHLENPDLHPGDSATPNQSSDTEIVFGVNTGILTIMISLHLAVLHARRLVSGTAKYWAEVTHRLVVYLESELCKRDDLKSYLLAAKRNADPKKMEPLIYE